ncbi:MAG: hypothetical protein WAM72_12145 [Xanthobacteraceae bacterium]
MPFSELIESEAPPEISLVYDELRTAIGIPVVNLIWRHLASLPDVLSWAWTTVRPVAGSTILAEWINQLEAIALKNVAHSAALFPAIPDDAMAVVETYNRGNCINLQLLTALRRAEPKTCCTSGSQNFYRKPDCRNEHGRIAFANTANGGESKLTGLRVGRATSRGIVIDLIFRPAGDV